MKIAEFVDISRENLFTVHMLALASGDWRIGRDGERRKGMERDGTGQRGTGRSGEGRGMGRGREGRDGMKRDGTG